MIVYVVLVTDVAGQFPDSVWTTLEAAEARELEIDGDLVEMALDKPRGTT